MPKLGPVIGTITHQLLAGKYIHSANNRFDLAPLIDEERGWEPEI